MLRMTPILSPATKRAPSPAAPLRVLHVLDVLSLSGMEYGVIKLVNRLDSTRFTPMVCCLRFQREVTNSLLREDVTIFELNRHEGWDWNLVGKLERLLREHRVDIVHSHNWQSFLYVVLAARRVAGAIVIHGEHGRETSGSAGRRVWISRWLARRVAHLTTVSRSLAKELVEQWGVSEDRVTTVPNGVDLAVFDEDCDLTALRAELGLSVEDRVVLSIGRLRPVKDHPTLLRAFARVRRAVPNCRLLIVGTDFGTGTGEALARLTDELGIAECTTFLGVRKDVPGLLRLANVYINTSLFEGMSNTILEAMAASRPVVATAVGGNTELVRDGHTGFLVPPGDEAAIAERVCALLADSALRDRLGAEGRARVEQCHTMAGMVGRYSDLYEECAAREKVRRETGAASLKTRLARGACRLGLHRASSRLRPQALNILMYHRVLPLSQAMENSFDAMVMPRDEFEGQMAYLARNCAVLSLSEAVEQLRAGALPRRAVVVTFDDGYADNYTHAWPVLKEYAIPATFFLVSGAIDRTVTLWWDEIAEFVRTHAVTGIDETEARNMPEWAARVLRRLNGGESPQRVSRSLVDAMNAASPHERRCVLEIVRSRVDTQIALSDLMLTWEQVERMSASGMEFGAHTVSHVFMDESDEREARREIEGSIRTLEQRLGRPVTSFSYPRGRTSLLAKQLLREARIKTAVTTAPGQNPVGSDLLQLKRLASGYYRSACGFDRALFEAELEGWFHRLRRD